MKRPFYLLDQLRNIVQGEPWPEIPEIAGRHRESVPRGGDASIRQPASQRLVDDIAEGPPGAAGFRLELGRYIVIQGDALPPTGSVRINGNAAWTRLPAVTLALAAADASGVAAMCISNAPSCTAWQPFAQARTWTLSPGDGVKVVYVWLRDRVGNVTPGPIQGQILLDGTAPGNPTVLTSSSHAVSTWSADRTVAIQWAGATDAGSGVSGYSLRWDRVPSTIPDAVADTTALTATSPSLPDGGNHYVHLRTVDRAGNWSGSAVHLGPFFIDGTPRPTEYLRRLREPPGSRSAGADSPMRRAASRRPIRTGSSTALPPTRPCGARTARRSLSAPRGS